MNRLCRVVMLVTCAIAGSGVVGFALARYSLAVLRSQFQPESPSELDSSHPKYKELLCGPASLSVALGRIGIERSPQDVASRCKVTFQGTALADLERVANSSDLVSANARRIGWDELCHLCGVAVLFVNGNHYLAVDPREASRSPQEAHTLRIYEPERSAQWWTREKLEGIWRGEALVITRRSDRRGERQGGASIDWEQCFVDCGVVAGSPRSDYRFTFRNVGDSDLVIADVEKACGCIHHSLSQERVAPRASAVIEVAVDLERTEGYFEKHVIVRTNDPMRPASVLRMAGGVPRARVISSDVVRLEDLPQGGRVSQEFYVADPGFSGVKIREARFAPHGAAGIGEHLSCLISYDRLGDDGQRLGSSVGFRAMAGDYVVRLAFDARTKCPLGPFRGEVNVVLEADGVATPQKLSVEGMVVKDVHPVPRLALITLDPEGAGSATIRLDSYSKKDIPVAKMWSDSPKSLEIRPQGGSMASNSEYIVTAKISDVVAGAVPLKWAVFFELDDGTVLSVPVAIFRPGRKEGGVQPVHGVR